MKHARITKLKHNYNNQFKITYNKYIAKITDFEFKERPKVFFKTTKTSNKNSKYFSKN